MEQNMLSELEDELNHIDADSLKLDAMIQLKTWQKKMHSLVDKTYKDRLQEIESMTINLTNEIKEKQSQIEHLDIHDEKKCLQLKTNINSLKSPIKIEESLPENFQYRIERTIRITHGEENQDEEFIDDDEDEPVIVDIDRHEVHVGDQVVLVVATPEQSSGGKQQEGTVSKVFNSQPVQHALSVGLAKALAQMGTIAATTTTTAAATTMAKTAIIATVCGVGTVAYGVGRLAMGTSRKVWSLVVSSEE